MIDVGKLKAKIMAITLTCTYECVLFSIRILFFSAQHILAPLSSSVCHCLFISLKAVCVHTVAQTRHTQALSPNRKTSFPGHYVVDHTGSGGGAPGAGWLAGRPPANDGPAVGPSVDRQFRDTHTHTHTHLLSHRHAHSRPARKGRRNLARPNLTVGFQPPARAVSTAAFIKRAPYNPVRAALSRNLSPANSRPRLA